MPKVIYFVQFPHCGYEHWLTKQERSTTTSGGFMLKDWNYGMHKRKFMKTSGICIDSSNNPLNTDLYFWGEWEPMSEALEIDPLADGHHMPRYLQMPFLCLKPNGRPTVPWYRNVKCTQGVCAQISGKRALCQNTDPYVFYDNFLYSCCRQTKGGKATILQHLKKDSIILFGSSFDVKTANPYFVVDTVFVVGDNRKYRARSASKDLSGFVPSVYDVVMGFKKWKGKDQYTCYHGVSYRENPVGPFSFVPCRTELQSDGSGFARPVINQSDLDSICSDLVNPKSYRTFGTSVTTAQQSSNLWNRIRELIEKQGFMLGVKFDVDISPIL